MQLMQRTFLAAVLLTPGCEVRWSLLTGPFRGVPFLAEPLLPTPSLYINVLAGL